MFERFKQFFTKQPTSSGDFGNTLFSIPTQRTATPKNSKNVLASYKNVPWVRAIVSKIADAIVQVPFTFYEENNKSKNYKILIKAGKQYRDKALNEFIKQEDLKTNDTITDFIENGTISKNAKILTGKEIIKLTSIYLELLGEAFWMIERGENSKLPITYWILNPTWIQNLPTVDDPTYKVLMPDGQLIHVPITEIIHFKNPDVSNPYGRGHGLVNALYDEVSTDENAAKYINNFFYNSARPDVVISAEGLKSDDVKRLEAEWLSKTRGFWKAYTPYFMSGEVKISQLSQNFKDMELVELRRYERDFILEVFGVPPEIMGIVENSNRATIQAANDIFQRWVLLPRLEVIRNALQSQLVPLFNINGYIDYENPVGEDEDYILEVGKTSPWSRTLNEWRELQGLEPIENGDYFLMPMNLLPQSKAIQNEEVKQEKQIQKQDEEGPTISNVELQRILEAVEVGILVSTIIPFLDETIRISGKNRLEELNMGDIDFDPRRDLIYQFLEEKGATMIKNINDTTVKQLRSELQEGILAGESIPKLRDRVSKVFNEAKGYRATRIARTETIRASNFGAIEAYNQAGVKMKAWLATMDDRVRDIHADADGQMVGIDEPFNVGGESLMYPGDYSGSPENTINCRCTIEPIVQNRSMYDTIEKRVQRWKSFDTEISKREKEMVVLLKKTFQKQQDAVNEELRRA